MGKIANWRKSWWKWSATRREAQYDIDTAIDEGRDTVPFSEPEPTLSLTLEEMFEEPLDDLRLWAADQSPLVGTEALAIWAARENDRRKK